MRESGTYEVRGAIASAWQKLRDERARLDAEEAALILQALANAKGVVALAARELGIARTTLASRLKVLGVRQGVMATRQELAPLAAEPVVRDAGGASRP